MPEPSEEQLIFDDTPSDGPATCGATLVDIGFDPLGRRWARAVEQILLGFGAVIVAGILAAILEWQRDLSLWPCFPLPFSSSEAS